MTHPFLFWRRIIQCDIKVGSPDVGIALGKPDGIGKSVRDRVGKVVSKGPNAFDFLLSGAPKDAKPLAFLRQK